MTFTVPVFHDGEVVAFSCCMAHWPDVGGTLDGATTDIYSEGLQMPIVKIYRKGVPNEELIEIIAPMCGCPSGRWAISAPRSPR